MINPIRRQRSNERPTHLAGNAIRGLGIAVAATAGILTACGSESSSANPARQQPAVSSSAAPTPDNPSSTDDTAPATNTPASPTTVAEAATVTPVDRPTAARDDTIVVDGTKIHFRCQGSGDATVVLIAGFESSSEVWAAVEPDLAEHARVCTFDAPGTGTSEPPTSIQTFVSQAAELHALLDAIGEPGPYLPVGHSFGGIKAITFASMFDDEVAGLVLVDASPLAWPEVLCAITDDGSVAAHAIRTMCDVGFDPNGNRELLDVFKAFAEAESLPDLGSLPMIVLTAVDHALPDDISDVERTRITEAWDAGQQIWARLSSAAQVVSIADSGHDIQLDHPDLVIEQIIRLLS